MMDKIGICDVQFVVGNGHEYFAKELAFCNLCSENVKQIALKPPYEKNLLDVKYQKQNAYNKSNINGLDWNDCDHDDEIEYQELNKHLTDMFSSTRLIFVKGLEKQRFLKKNGPDLLYVDLDSNCPSLKTLSLPTTTTINGGGGKICRKVAAHTNAKFVNNCACKNVLKLQKYANEFPDMVVGVVGRIHIITRELFLNNSVFSRKMNASDVIEGVNKWCVGFVPVSSSSSSSSNSLEEILGLELFLQSRRFQLSVENKHKLEEWGFCFDENNVVLQSPVPWKEGIRFLKADPRHVRFVLDDGRIVFKAFIKNTYYEKIFRITVNDKRVQEELYEKIYSYLKRLELLNVDINLREDINSLVGKLQRSLKIDNETCVSTPTAAAAAAEVVDVDFIKTLGEGRSRVVPDCA